MTYILIAAVVFLGCLILARFQSEKGMKLLTNEQRGALVQSYSKTRVVSVLILSFIMIGFLLIAYYVNVDKKLAIGSYFGAIMVYYIVTGILALSKLKDLGLPDEFIMYSKRAAWIRIAGLCVFVVLTAIGLMGEILKQ